MNDNNWTIFQGNGNSGNIEKLPPPPPWRPFGKKTQIGQSRRKYRGLSFHVREKEIKMINAALYLRRPLLITGNPGVGKSSLAYKVAEELKLGEVLYWPITTRTTLKDGLYNYDAIGRLQEVKLKEQNQGNLTKDEQKKLLKQIEKYITLGPLGTALLPSKKPRVLLIDEIDKSDIDLPNDLLTLFEEGRFEIPELVRIKEEVDTVTVRTAYTDDTQKETAGDKSTKIIDGLVYCEAFPFVVLTSNGVRDFPAPFLRRCLRLKMNPPERDDLVKIIEKHLDSIEGNEKIYKLIDTFIEKREQKSEILATDQLLNAIFMVKYGEVDGEDELLDWLLKDLGSDEDD